MNPLSHERWKQSNSIPRGGRGGIRTPDRIAPTPDFESGALNHSATLPLTNNKLLTNTVGPVIFLLYPVFFDCEIKTGHATETPETGGTLVQRRQVAFVSQGAEPATVRQQRGGLWQNQSGRQDHSRQTEIDLERHRQIAEQIIGPKRHRQLCRRRLLCPV